ncbi:MAG: glycoside hydrolase family 2 [Clostridia bacterium]|nr:glycoside hydrolase family 2 [Clostridia bacterium]
MLHLRNEYPRPHFRRDNWLSLNGTWEFEFDDNHDGEMRGIHNGKIKLEKEINVPFSYQYPASGIGDKTFHDTLWYKKSFVYNRAGDSAILGFNASDYITTVWVNSHYATTHQGGFAPFTVDITKYLSEGENVIVVRCYDPLDPTIPRGKQSWLNDPFSCWYTPNSGIWQSVWIDFVGDDSIEDFSITPDIDTNSFSGEIKLRNALADLIEIKVFYDNKLIKRQMFSPDGKYTRYTVNMMEINFVDEVTYWAPEHPNLFYVDINLYKENILLDTVHTRFGMRKISITDDGRVLLNNKPLYQRLILDQGYWKDSGLTPPSVEAIKADIEFTKAAGFNGARKHQKFEDPYYYYLADELGLLTWCEMPSSYNFNSDEVSYVTAEWQQIVNTAKKFSSIITYVPINESWGVRKALTSVEQQNFARSLYYITKSIDPSRLVSTNDGWENLSESDMLAIHDYSSLGGELKVKYNEGTYDDAFQTFRRVLANGNPYMGQPVLLSEFGGIMFERDQRDGNWGYNSAAKNDDEFLSRLKALVDGIYDADFQGFCYTQLTDVQQEVNGLLDSDHNPKIAPEKIREILVK